MFIQNIQTIDQFASKTSWMYNAELALAYLIAVRFQKGEQTLIKFEPLLHATPILLGLLAAIIPLPYQAYNHAGGAFCWLAPSPGGCDKVVPGDGGQTCTSGTNYVILRIWLSFVPCFVTQAIVLITMICLLLTVFRIERRGGRYNASANSRRNTKRVALKCALYVLAFEITWFFNLWGVVEFWSNPANDHEVNGPESMGGWTTVKYMLNLALLPTYGIWSSIAYFILPFLKMRKEHPEWGFFEKLRKTVLPPPRGDYGASGWCCLRIMPFCCGMNKAQQGESRHTSTLDGGGIFSNVVSSSGDGEAPETASMNHVVTGVERTYFEDEDDYGHMENEECEQHVTR